MKKEVTLIVLVSLIIVFSVSALPVFYQGLMNVGILSSKAIVILYPISNEYNFSLGDNLILNLNVSSSVTLETWWYNLTDLTHNRIVKNKEYFTPNTTINVVRGDNLLIVYGNDSSGNIYSRNVNFSVNVPNAPPVIHLTENNIYGCEQTSFLYIFNTTDLDEDILSFSLDPQHPINPFYIDFYDIINFTSNNYRIYSGNLSKSDAGGVNNSSKTYSVNITMNDNNLSEFKSLNITIIETNNLPIIQNIGVKTVSTNLSNNTFYYQVLVNDSEDGDSFNGDLFFNISFNGGEELFNISNNGIMTFNANASYIGTHNITICVEDNGLTNPHQNLSLCNENSLSKFICQDFNLVVTFINNPPNITSHFPINLNINGSGDESFSFTIIKTDPDGLPIDSYWYVDNVLTEYDPYNFENWDSFVYNPLCGVSGAHEVKIVITDGDLNMSLIWNVSLTLVSCPVTSGSSSSGGGGGGSSGGGYLEYTCKENWGCDKWQNCINLNKAFLLKLISDKDNKKILDLCDVFLWGQENCGYQTRICNKLDNCSHNDTMPQNLRECYYTYNPTCYDGIKNCHDDSCEVFIDCGGSCEACPSCSDKIKNQGEMNIDCGGPCYPCYIENPLESKASAFFYILISLLILVLIMVVVYIHDLINKFYKIIPKKVNFKK